MPMATETKHEKLYNFRFWWKINSQPLVTVNQLSGERKLLKQSIAKFSAAVVEKSSMYYRTDGKNKNENVCVGKKGF